MEEWGQVPSQPSNYVSILDLRERWLKENGRKQKENDDLKQLEPQEQGQKSPRTEPPEKKDDQKPVIRKPRRNASSWSRNGSEKFQRCYRAVPVSNPLNVSEICKKTEDKGEPELAVPRIEKDEKKEKKIKRQGRKKNPRLQKEEMDKTSPKPEENLKEEMKEKECEVGVQNGKKIVRAGKIEEKKGTGSLCGSGKTGCTHDMKEIENKLSLISVSFEIKKGRNNDDYRGSRNNGDYRGSRNNGYYRGSGNNGDYRGSSQGNRNFRYHRNLDRWGPRKQRDIGNGMIWVKKDELSKGA